MIKKLTLFFRDSPIKLKLSILSSVTTALALFAGCAVFVTSEIYSELKASAAELKVIARITGDNSRSAILFNDTSYGLATLERLVAQPDITAAALYTSDGKLFSFYSEIEGAQAPQEAAADPVARLINYHFIIFEPIMFDGEKVGSVYLKATSKALLERIGTNIALTVSIFFVTLIISALAWARLRNLITAPIERLASATREVTATKDYAKRVEKDGDDELGDLIDGFNNMLSLIQERDDELAARADELEKRVAARTAELSESNRLLKEELLYRERTEAALRKAKEDAEAASRAKSEFLANMSHELRTPLNAILGFTQLLIVSDLNREQRRSVELVSAAGENLLSLIQDILDLSRIEEGRLELNLNQFDLGLTIDKTADQFAALACSKGLELVLSVDDAARALVVGDDYRIRQILTNLIGNAVKFTSEGTIKLTARLAKASAEREKAREKFIFEVEDTGPGIPAGMKDKIFDRFTQVDGAFTRKHGGAGLGVTISKELVEMMGGSIWVESEVGRGSCFGFEIELERKGFSETYPREPISPKVADSEILIMTASKAQATVAREILERFKIKTRWVAEERGALEALREIAPRSPNRSVVALVDHTFGAKGAVEFIDQALAVAAGSIKVILTAPINVDLSSTEITSRIDGYLYQPIKARLLARALNELAVGDSQEIELLVAKPRNALDDRFTRELTILLAEDTEVNQELIKLVLSKLGLKTVVANNGREAVEIFEREKIDLILMDVQMPELDGLSATRIIREKERADGSLGRVPIVALTAHAMESDKEICLSSGMDRYLSKPVKIDKLKEVIKELTGDDRAAEDADAKKTEGIVEVMIDKFNAPGKDSTPTPRYNLEGILWLCDNDQDRFGEFMAVLIDSLKEWSADIARLDHRADEESVRLIAHKVKGTLGTLESNEGHELARQIQTIEKELWSQSAPGLIKKLHAIIEALIDALSGELRSGKSTPTL